MKTLWKEIEETEEVLRVSFADLTYRLFHQVAEPWESTCWPLSSQASDIATWLVRHFGIHGPWH